MLRLRTIRRGSLICIGKISTRGGNPIKEILSQKDKLSLQFRDDALVPF